MCAAPAAAAALAVLFPIIFNHPFPFFPLTIVFLVIDIVTSARIASVCIEDIVVRINKYTHTYIPTWPNSDFHRLFDSGFAPSALSLCLNDISYTKHVNTDWFAFRISLARCSARLRLVRGSGQLGSAGSVRLYSGLDSAAHLELGSGLCSELDLVRLSSVSGLSLGEADKSADLLTSH